MSVACLKKITAVGILVRSDFPKVHGLTVWDGCDPLRCIVNFPRLMEKDPHALTAWGFFLCYFRLNSDQNPLRVALGAVSGSGFRSAPSVGLPVASC